MSQGPLLLMPGLQEKRAADQESLSAHLSFEFAVALSNFVSTQNNLEHWWEPWNCKSSK